MERPASSRNKKSSGTNEANSAQVLEQIKRRQFRPVYLFFGPERYLLDELAAALKVALADEVNAGFDYDLLDGETSSLSAVLNLANTPPWLAERRLVLVKNAPWFRGNKKSKADNEETDSASPSTFVEPAGTGASTKRKAAEGKDSGEEAAFLNYLKEPNPTTVLVMLTAGEVDRRRKLFRTLVSNGTAVECRELNDRERRPWLSRQARVMGLTLESAALDYLITFGGKSLYGLINELEKLRLFLGEGQTRVSLAVVQELCSRSVEDRIFDIMQAFTEKNAPLALSRIRELIEAGTQPQRIFFLLVRHYRIMLRARSLLDQAYSDQELASRLQVDYRLVYKYMREARGFSEAELTQGLKQMLEIDVSIKTSEGSPGMWLELLVAKAMNRG